jgi:hypothetical protein
VAIHRHDYNNPTPSSLHLDMTWADFRNQLLGPTDPAGAPKDSIRGSILENWQVCFMPTLLGRRAGRQ